MPVSLHAPTLGSKRVSAFLVLRHFVQSVFSAFCCLAEGPSRFWDVHLKNLEYNEHYKENNDIIIKVLRMFHFSV